MYPQRNNGYPCQRILDIVNSDEMDHHIQKWAKYPRKKRVKIAADLADQLGIPDRHRYTSNGKMDIDTLQMLILSLMANGADINPRHKRERHLWLAFVDILEAVNWLPHVTYPATPGTVAEQATSRRSPYRIYPSMGGYYIHIGDSVDHFPYAWFPGLVSLGAQG